MSDPGLSSPVPAALPVFYSTPEEAAAVYGTSPAPQPAPLPAPVTPSPAAELPTFYSTPEEAAAAYPQTSSAAAPAPEPSLAAAVVPGPTAGPPPEKSGFFTGIGAGGQEALRLGAQTLQGRPFEIDPNAPPPDTGDEGWWYRFGKGVGYSSPTLAAGLGGGAIGTALGSLGGPAAPISAPTAGIVGAGIGVGAMSLAQALAPSYIEAVQQHHMDHDAAVNYALTKSTATGVLSGATAWLPGPFKSAAGQILYQTFFTQPASGAIVRTGVPLVMGESLPSVGEYIEGAGQDVMAGAGFAGAHAAGRRAYQAVRPPPEPVEPPTAREQYLPAPPSAARETFSPSGEPSATEQIATPAPAPALSTIFPQPRPGEVTRTEIAPEQFPPTAEFGPAPTRIDVTPTEPAGVRPSEPVPVAAVPAPLAAEAPAGREGPPPSAPAVATGSRLPAEEPLPARSAASEAGPAEQGVAAEPSLRPPEPAVGEPVDRPGAAAGRPAEPAPMGEAGPARVEPGPGEIPGGPRLGADTGERPPDTQGAHPGERPGEQPAPLPAVPAGEARPEVGAEPATRETPTPAGEQAAPVASSRRPATAAEMEALEARVQRAADALAEAAAAEPARPAEERAALTRELIDARRERNTARDRGVPAEAPATEQAAPVETRRTAVSHLTAEPDHTVPGQYVAKNAGSERVLGKGATPEEAIADARRRGGAPYAEELPAARAPEDYRTLNPDISATEYSRRLTELRNSKPRPINKLWNNPDTAPPDQVEAARQAIRDWNREYRQVNKAHGQALERDNAAYRARQERPAIAEERPAIAEEQAAPTRLEDQAVVPGPREDAGTTGPREAVSETGPGLSTERPPARTEPPTQLEQLTAERDRLAAKSRTLDESRELRRLNRQIEDLQPRPAGDTQLGKLLDTRDALEAKSRTLDETLKLRGVNRQIENLRRAEERRGGRNLPYSGPPETGRPRDFLDYKFNDGTSVFRSIFEETGRDPDRVATQWSIQRQNEVLADHMANRFGFSGVTVVGSRGREATPVEHKLARDAMLDMTRALQDGMATMGLPLEGASLSAANLGKPLKLVIEPEGSRKYYGAYVPAEGEIRVIGGANSFGHEWTHALDHLLTQWATGNPAQMTKLFSMHTREGNLDPTNDVHAAFAKVINTLFYDKGALALHQINLEIAAQKTDRAGNPTKAALEAQRQLDNLEKGASQQRIQPSEFRQQSAQVNPKKAGYWTSAWEMLARSHEAYLAWKMHLEGKDPRGFVMPDEAYNNETDRQLKLAYPKDDERVRIFEAWDQLHEAVLKEQILSGGKAPTGFSNYGRSDMHYWAVTAPNLAKTMVGRAFAEEARKFSNLAQSVANVRLYDPNRPVGPHSLGTRFADGFKAATYSIHGIMETLIDRAPLAAQARLRSLMDLVATAPGEGRYTAANFEEAVRNRSRGWMQRYANTLRNNGLDPEHVTAEQDAMLRHVMVSGEVRLDGNQIPPNIVKAAGDLRFLMDQMWDASRKAGLEVGYSSRYFPRLYDQAKFFADPEGFRRDATKLYAFMFDRDVGAPGSDPQTFLEKWTTLSRVERAQADPGLEAGMAELNKNLRRQREIEENPNPTPAETAELNQLKIDATQLAQDHHDGLRDHVAGVAADHWHARLAKGNHADFDTVGPSGKYLNARVLPPEADIIMKDWMHTDTRDALPNYIHAVSRKVSYAERFGAKGEALEAAFEELRNVPGVNHEDMKYFRDLINQVTGRNNDHGPFYNKVASINNVLHAVGQVALMPRAVWSALAEPMNAALATGNARVGFQTFAHQLGFLFNRASALERTEFANFLNVTTSSMHDSIILSRMSADYSNTPLLNKLLTMYYKVTGLTQLTNSQRTAAAASSNWFLAKLSRDYGGTNARARDDATRWFRELGLNDRIHGDFAKWMDGLGGDLPSIERLQTDDMASAYGLAIRRLADRIIQDPYKADRAALSSTPIIGLAFQLMSFNYQFQRNVLGPVFANIEHSYGRAKLEAEAAGAGRVGATAKGVVMAGGTATHAAAMAGTMIAAGVMTTALRQLIFAPDQWAQHEKDGDLWDYILNLAFQRSGLNGTLDPIIQLFTNLRYNADITSILGGATPHWIGRNAQDIITPFVSANDSPNSNTRIYNATRGAYNLFGVPLMATGLTLAGNIGGPVSKVVAGGLLQYGTSPGAAAGVTEAIVGSPKGAKRVDDDKEETLMEQGEKLSEQGDKLSDDEDAGAGKGGGLSGAGLGILDDFLVPAWRYGGPVVAGLPRTVKAGAAAAGALYGGSKYLEATEPYRGQPAPEHKQSARQ